jgi:hypothetical protein
MTAAHIKYLIILFQFLFLQITPPVTDYKTFHASASVGLCFSKRQKWHWTVAEQVCDICVQITAKYVT